MISVKNAKEIEKMRAAGKIIGDTHRYVQQFVKPGVTTRELDKLAEDFILSHGARPNFKNYNGFPNAACISVNDVVIHGIPGGYVLKDGDIVSLDFGAELNGYHSDAARTHPVGKISKEAQRLIDVTRECFYEGIKEARAGRRVGDISNAVQVHAERNGFSVVRAFVGHGIGKKLHEEPSIPNFGAAGSGPLLQAGYVLAVEPMINQGSWQIKIEPDHWTVRTIDGKLSAHYENTLLVTYQAPEILTD